MAEYFPLRKWIANGGQLDEEDEPVSHYVTPFVAKALKEKECRLNSEMTEELRDQQKEAQLSLQKGCLARNKRRRDILAQKNAQKYADDVKHAAEYQKEQQRHSHVMGLSAREQMLQEVNNAKESTTSSRTFESEQSRQNRLACADAEKARYKIEEGREEAWRNIESVWKQSQDRDRIHTSAALFSELKHQVESHSLPSAICPHFYKARPAYFRFGAQGNFLPSVARASPRTEKKPSSRQLAKMLTAKGMKIPKSKAEE